jgi:LysR family tcuABC transcriptional regulator
MELRQLRYFVRVVELGSMSRAAVDLDVVQSAVSQQIARLEGELATRLLQRGSNGVTATEAGLAFFQQAQLALRHADEAGRAAQQSRLSGRVSVGLAPTTASVLGRRRWSVTPLVEEKLYLIQAGAAGASRCRRASGWPT